MEEAGKSAQMPVAPPRRKNKVRSTQNGHSPGQPRKGIGPPRPPAPRPLVNVVANGNTGSTARIAVSSATHQALERNRSVPPRPQMPAELIRRAGPERPRTPPVRPSTHHPWFNSLPPRPHSSLATTVTEQSRASTEAATNSHRNPKKRESNVSNDVNSLSIIGSKTEGGSSYYLNVAPRKPKPSQSKKDSPKVHSRDSSNIKQRYFQNSHNALSKSLNGSAQKSPISPVSSNQQYTKVPRPTPRSKVKPPRPAPPSPEVRKLMNTYSEIRRTASIDDDCMYSYVRMGPRMHTGVSRQVDGPSHRRNSEIYANDDYNGPCATKSSNGPSASTTEYMSLRMESVDDSIYTDPCVVAERPLRHSTSLGNVTSRTLELANDDYDGPCATKSSNGPSASTTEYMSLRTESMDDSIYTDPCVVAKRPLRHSTSLGEYGNVTLKTLGSDDMYMSLSETTLNEDSEYQQPSPLAD